MSNRSWLKRQSRPNNNHSLLCIANRSLVEISSCKSTTTAPKSDSPRTTTAVFLPQDQPSVFKLRNKGSPSPHCQTYSHGWDAKRIVSNQISQYNLDAGRPQDHKSGFHTVLYYLAKELNEFCRKEDSEEIVRVMFGALITF